MNIEIKNNSLCWRPSQAYYDFEMCVSVFHYFEWARALSPQTKKWGCRRKFPPSQAKVLNMDGSLKGTPGVVCPIRTRAAEVEKSPQENWRTWPVWFAPLGGINLVLSESKELRVQVDLPNHFTKLEARICAISLQTQPRTNWFVISDVNSPLFLGTHPCI